MPAQDWDDYIAQLRHRKTEARSQGGPEAIARAHGRGKLTARERLAFLLDEDSFQEIGLLAEGSGFVGWSGPTLVRGGLGEEVDINRLAGPDMHARTTGFVDRVLASEQECLAAIRTFLPFMPQNCWELPPRLGLMILLNRPRPAAT